MRWTNGIVVVVLLMTVFLAVLDRDGAEGEPLEPERLDPAGGLVISWAPLYYKNGTYASLSSGGTLVTKAFDGNISTGVVLTNRLLYLHFPVVCNITQLKIYAVGSGRISLEAGAGSYSPVNRHEWTGRVIYNLTDWYTRRLAIAGDGNALTLYELEVYGYAVRPVCQVFEAYNYTNYTNTTEIHDYWITYENHTHEHTNVTYQNDTYPTFENITYENTTYPTYENTIYENTTYPAYGNHTHYNATYDNGTYSNYTNVTMAWPGNDSAEDLDLSALLPAPVITYYNTTVERAAPWMAALFVVGMVFVLIAAVAVVVVFRRVRRWADQQIGSARQALLPPVEAEIEHEPHIRDGYRSPGGARPARPGDVRPPLLPVRRRAR